MRYLTIIFLFIATFATGQQQMFLRSTPAAGVTGILDSYTGAAAAYATALLYSGYSGSCLRVRRDSDNAEQDIGFSGTGIDEAAINSFCSGANCFVKTWYDQSGNGNDATQTTTANQPKIYDSATGIVYDNGIAALEFDGSNDHLFKTAVNLSQPTSYVSVQNWQTSATNRYILDGDATNRHTIGAFFAGGTFGMYSPTTFLLDGSSTTGQKVFFSFFNGASSGFAVNGSNTTGTVGTGPIGDFFIGGRPTFVWLGTIQVLVAWESNQSSNRTAIETIINNYFSIY